MHATGDYSISALAELFSVSRPTFYRTLRRGQSPALNRYPPGGAYSCDEKRRHL